MQAVSVSALYNSEIKTKVFPGMQHQAKHTCAYYRNTEVPYNPVMFSSTSKFLSPVIQLGERLFCTPRSFSGSLRQICPDIRHSLVQEGHLIVWTVVRNFPPAWEKQVLRATEDPRWSPKICPFFYSRLHGMKLKSITTWVCALLSVYLQLVFSILVFVENCWWLDAF